MAHVGGEGFGVDAGDCGIGVAALVQADRLKLGGLPGRACPFDQGIWGKRLAAAASKDKIIAGSLRAQPMSNEVDAKRLCQGDPALAGTALWLDRRLRCIRAGPV